MVGGKHRVAILLATLNGAQFLPEQLKSYCDQTHSDWELLISDDGSTDGTVELLRNFAESVPEPVTLLQGPQQGFWRNFMSLVQRSPSSAEYFAFSDQDDIWSERKLEKAVAYFKSLPSDAPAMYFTRTMLVDRRGVYVGLSPLFARAPSFQNALVQNIGGGNTMVFNRAARSALLATPDVAIVAHDWWAYQVITGIGGKAFYDTWPSLKYRQHGGNLLGSNAGVLARTYRIRAVINGRFSEWNDKNIDALNKMKSLLSPANAVSLDNFDRSRKAALPKRIYLIWKSGVYRQQVLENVGLYAASVMNKI